MSWYLKTLLMLLFWFSGVIFAVIVGNLVTIILLAWLIDHFRL